MYVIDKDYKDELIIKNSRFITLVYKIYNNDIGSILDKIKNEYKDATHYTYAYIVNGMEKACDDGEPSGTAGMPILKVIKNYDLTNILVVVVRYFGGIKLGANGLIRAYSKGIANILKEVKLKELIPGYNVNLIFNYDSIKDVDYLLKDIHINSKDFSDKIIYNIDIDNLDILHGYDYKVIKDIYMER